MNTGALSRSCRRLLRELAKRPNGAAGRPVMYLNACGNVGHLQRRAGKTLGDKGLVVAMLARHGDPWPCCIALNDAGREWLETHCEHRGHPLTDRGAHGLGCEVCAELEEAEDAFVRLANGG